MRSFHDHLRSLRREEAKIAMRPVHRSSAIFPIVENSVTSSRILFLNYWALKRGVLDIAALFTLRSMQGEILWRKEENIQKIRAYGVEVGKILAEIGVDSPFFGSLEVEFFSAKDLRFGYPAVVINWYGSTFSTFVHTAGRIYNDHEDYALNSMQKVPEGGFNLLIAAHTHPFATMINGPEEAPAQIITLSLSSPLLQEAVIHKLPFPSLAPYESRWIDLRSIFELTSLQGNVASCSLTFDLPWVYPRLIVGNRREDPLGYSLTHTYYDSHLIADESAYWRPSDVEWYDLSLALPLFFHRFAESSITFYPIYSPATFHFSLEVYRLTGERILSLTEVLRVDGSESGLSRISMEKFLAERAIVLEEAATVRIIAEREEKKIPSRLKISLDIGGANALATNICVNLHPFNPSLEKVTKAFRWAPLFVDRNGGSFWLVNSSPKKLYERSCLGTITFFREKDEATLCRTFVLPPHGAMEFFFDDDKELLAFFSSRPGWAVVDCDNPFLTTYTFSLGSDIAIGGDHGF